VSLQTGIVLILMQDTGALPIPPASISATKNAAGHPVLAGLLAAVILGYAHRNIVWSCQFVRIGYWFGDPKGAGSGTGPSGFPRVGGSGFFIGSTAQVTPGDEC
jgi:hypothetical protein